MKLRTRLLLANASTVVVPVITTVLIALAAFFVFGKLFGFGISYEHQQKQSMIKFELLSEASNWRHTPEILEEVSYQQYLCKKLAEIKGELLLIKDDGVEFSSRDFSKIEVAKTIEAGNETGGREPVVIDNISYTVLKTDIKYKDGSPGSILLLTPEDRETSLTSFLILGLVSFLLSFVLTNIVALYQFSRSIISPLHTLQSAAAEIAKGNLDHSISEEGDQEIQALCRDLELMRIKLKDSVHTQLKYEDNRKLLISSISHDLKTPVTSIKGYVEGILDGIASNPEKMERYLRTISLKAYQIDQMIDDLLLYAKLDLNQIPFDFERIDIEDYLGIVSVLENEPELERNQIKIAFHNELGQKRYVLIDQKRMKRVIMNILDNSCKYMSDGQGEIEIYLRETVSSIIFELRDNGSGINESDLPYIFDRFYRSDPARSKGSGLGLAIAKQIIEGHNGRVWAVSHGKEGTSIMISLSKS